MDFEFSFSNGEQLALAKVAGRPTLGQFMSLIDVMGSDSHEWKHNRLLVDLTGVQTLTSFTDQFAIGEKAARVLSHLHVASVVLPHRITRVSEKAANRGGAHVHVFTDEAEARAWLEATTGTPSLQPLTGG
ncbi:MAG TPA: STAS/SEC14 domain-containing protein [Methylomirabilota bacterium]|jgi:hypothetical protein|nr:STAS/SEC14 domain-containing protein [Methylomirabilota bacterium]